MARTLLLSNGMARRRALGLLIALAPLMMVACRIAPRGPVDLRDAHVVQVYLGAKGARQSFCPGEAAPLDVVIDAVLPGDDRTTRFHTHREDLWDWLFDPVTLRMASAQGSIDEEAIFHASRDPLVSANGYLIDLHTSGPAFGLRFPPSYECVTTFGSTGRIGESGRDGERGPWTVDEPMAGQTGGDGGAGGPGPSFRVFVTWVRTPYYPKLLAAVAEAGFDGVALAPPDRALTITARGGDGGAGGRGGPGAPGQYECRWNRRKKEHSACLPTVDLKPGFGGTGGAGGEGGTGGELEVHVDRRYPEIAERLALDVRGGAGGIGGRGGAGGNNAVSSQYAMKSEESEFGTPGRAGANGAAGANGTSRIVFDDIAPVFARVKTIEPL